MQLRKGMRVQELTKKVGQIPKRGKVLDIHDHSVEVLWDDGHTSSLAQGLLFPVKEKKSD